VPSAGAKDGAGALDADRPVATDDLAFPQPLLPPDRDRAFVPATTWFAVIRKVPSLLRQATNADPKLWPAEIVKRRSSARGRRSA